MKLTTVAVNLAFRELLHTFLHPECWVSLFLFLFFLVYEERIPCFSGGKTWFHSDKLNPKVKFSNTFNRRSPLRQLDRFHWTLLKRSLDVESPRWPIEYDSNVLPPRRRSSVHHTPWRFVDGAGRIRKINVQNSGWWAAAPSSFRAPSAHHSSILFSLISLWAAGTFTAPRVLRGAGRRLCRLYEIRQNLPRWHSARNEQAAPLSRCSSDREQPLIRGTVTDPTFFMSRWLT